MRYLDDILILIGLLMLGAYTYLSFGLAHTLAYTGAVFAITGFVLGLRQKGGSA